MTWRIQLAFQGGGARIAELLVTLDVIQKLELSGDIEVTRVSGVSAGAIVAAIASANVSARLALVRTRSLLNDSPDDFSIDKPKWRLAWDFSRGNPLLPRDRLEEIFETLWSELCGETPRRLFGDLEKPLHIIASDIVEKTKKVFRSKDEPIIASMLHSCAIPIIYRTLRDINSNQNWVDGGLVDNLPVATLKDEEELYGSVVAVSFDKDSRPTKPKNQLEYIISLFDLAIAHQVENTRAGQNPDHVLSLKSKLDFLDFQNAFNMYHPGGDLYPELHDYVEGWFRNRINLSVKPEVSAQVLARLPAGLKSTIYSGSVDGAFSSSYKKLSSALVVSAGSLVAGSEPDTIYRINNISSETDGTIIIPVSSSRQEDATAARRIFVTNEFGSIVPSKLIPVEYYPPREKEIVNSSVAQISKSLISFESFSENREPRKFKLQDEVSIYGAFNSLKTKGHDVLVLHHSESETIPSVDLVIFIPQSFGQVEGVFLSTADDKKLRSGRKLSLNELEAYVRLLPHGFYAIGWQVENFIQGETVRINLSLPAV